MHGIFVGEIQALEGAGRTTFDFDDEDVPFQLKLDMARQCWDESRHCEISVKLAEHMGTEIGEFTEATFLYEAACTPDPLLRLTGVNRALEGLAIDVFNTMKEFGDSSGDPVLAFCEDWMLADEVTHVKMGSDWLRRLTENDPERRERALEFQRTVDKLFNLGGFRGETDENPIQLARKFRELAGFTDEENDELSEVDGRGPGRGRRRGRAAEPLDSARPRMARVQVTPEPFTLVEYDAGVIAGIVEELAALVGVPDDVDDRASRSTRSCRSRSRAAPPTSSTAASMLWFSGANFEDSRHRTHVRRADRRDRARDGAVPRAPTASRRLRRRARRRRAHRRAAAARGRRGPTGGPRGSARSPGRCAASTCSASTTGSPTSPTPRSSGCGPRRRRFTWADLEADLRRVRGRRPASGAQEAGGHPQGDAEGAGANRCS